MNVPTTTITILLAENGRMSHSHRIRHLNIGYFSVTDKIEKGEVKVAFSPMHDMLMEASTGGIIHMGEGNDPKSAW